MFFAMVVDGEREMEEGFEREDGKVGKFETVAMA